MLLMPILTGIWKRLEAWDEVIRQRRELEALSDHLLKDIGLSRVDAEREASRPFWDLGPPPDPTLHRRGLEQDRPAASSCSDCREPC